MTLTYRTATVDGLKVFYRTAGDPKHPSCCCCTAFRLHRTCFAI